MGAHNAHAEFDGNLTKEQLKEAYDKHIDQLLFEYGHDGYNGTLSTCNGLIVSDKKFDTVEEAEKYGLDHTEKWEAAMAVWCKNVVKVKTQFTYGGTPAYSLANRPIDMVWAPMLKRSTLQVADQLTETEGTRLIKLYTAHAEAAVAMHAANMALHPMIQALTLATEPLPSDHFSKLKRESAAYRKLREKATKTEVALNAEIEKLTAKYIKEETKQDKPLWVVSGWAAS